MGIDFIQRNATDRKLKKYRKIPSNVHEQNKGNGIYISPFSGLESDDSMISQRSVVSKGWFGSKR